MATHAQIKDTTEELPDGAVVRVRKKDGSEVKGKVHGTRDGSIVLEGAEDVDFDDVDAVLLDARSKGPE